MSAAPIAGDSAPARAGPLPDRAARVAPFAIAAALPIVLTLLFGPDADSPQFIASAALTAVLIVMAFLVPWKRVPPPLRATVPLTSFVVVFLLRDSSTTAAAVYTPLVLLPVIWLALYGNRGQLLIALVCLVLSLIIPIVVIGAPHYPPSEWRRVALYLAIAPIVGLTIQRLVTEIRVRADRLTRSEASLRESEARFQTAYEHAPVGMGLVGADGRFISVNSALTAITGYSREELLARSTSDLTHPADRERSEQLMHDLVAGDLDNYHEEKRYIHADGHVIDIALDVALVRDTDGAPLHTVGQVVDITERKRQAADRERQLALTQRAREQLAEQNARLRELDRLKDEFVALVSHELRTPLTSIAGYLEPLLDQEAGPLTPTQDRFLKTVERNAQRLAVLVNDLLFLASVDAGKLTIQRRPIDLSSVVADAGEAAAPVARRRGVALIVEPGEARAIQGDRARLAQLADNLVSNAIKFTPEGGRVDIRAGADATHAIVEVRDNGIGMREDEIPQLFTRFFRAESATNHSISGTGLGLAIAKSIADAHHGSIEVESKLGEGTTMRLLLPLDGDGHDA